MNQSNSEHSYKWERVVSVIGVRAEAGGEEEGKGSKTVLSWRCKRIATQYEKDMWGGGGGAQG